MLKSNRKCHEEKGDKKQWKSWLYKAHRIFMARHGVKFNKEWLESQIAKYV